MQFRKHLPDARLHDLLDIFRSRKGFFMDWIERSSDLIKNQACLRKGVILNDDEKDTIEYVAPAPETQEEIEEFGIMYTKVRAAFRLIIHKAGQQMKNKGLMNVAFRM